MQLSPGPVDCNPASAPRDEPLRSVTNSLADAAIASQNEKFAWDPIAARENVSIAKKTGDIPIYECVSPMNSQA
jgi:hypothetical protein